MSGQAYVGTAKRTFRSALYHLLEKSYKILGSRRILEMMAGDIEEIVEEFYPNPQYIRSGWMVFTGTKASGGKARIGQSADDHELVTIAWPVLIDEDLDGLAAGIPEKSDHPKRSAWFQKRLVRIIEFGMSHSEGPVLLTLADLSAMLGISTVQVSCYLQEVRNSSGKQLITKGHYFDQGVRPTHKEEILDLYEEGLDESDIARRTGHAQDSVGNYIRGYERVRLLCSRNIPFDQISPLIGMSQGLVNEYLKILSRHHPEFFPDV